MKRTVEVELETKAAKFETALRRFFKKYPELNYWREEFEYMFEHGIDFECDNKFADGTENKDWSYALHLDVEDGGDKGYFFYLCIIERA